MSEERMDIVNEFIEEFKDRFSAAVLVGSRVYREPHTDSDVDLLVLMDRLEEWERACKSFKTGNSEEFMLETRQLYLRGKAEYFCIKFRYKGHEFSVDFIPTNQLKMFIEDMKAAKSIVYFKATNRPQHNPYLFRWKCSSLLQKKENIAYTRSILVSSPLCTKKERLFMGILPDKLITGYSFLWGEKGHAEEIERFCTESMRVLIRENNASGPHEVIGSVNRSPLLPDEYVAEQMRRWNAKIEKI